MNGERQDVQFLLQHCGVFHISHSSKLQPLGPSMLGRLQNYILILQYCPDSSPWHSFGVWYPGDEIAVAVAFVFPGLCHSETSHNCPQKCHLAKLLRRMGKILFPHLFPVQIKMIRHKQRAAALGNSRQPSRESDIVYLIFPIYSIFSRIC